MDLDERDILLSFSYGEKGDWESIYASLKNKKEVTEGMKEEAYQCLKSYFLTICDKDYPDYFKVIEKPPFLLYCYGNVSLLKAVHRLTVVGTRNPTIYQSDTLYSLITQTEKKMSNELVIVSGMAKGLDQEAMEAAMESEAPIIAVLGSGIDNPYPVRNTHIYDYCKSGKGLVLSEYPNMLQPKPENFVFRNRLLAAIGQCLFVAGGRNRSGTHTTVRYALDSGKEIMALPCNITGDDLTNSLIKDGAIPILSSDDIVDIIRNMP